ncbi:MAG: DUF4340 domain-containing protein [Fibrobacteres bacterium]|nr:DUF4340 domain-containing protein [Fibrobacterota bacterium]
MTPMKRNLILLGVLAALVLLILFANNSSANRKKPLLFKGVKRETVTQITISKYAQSETLRKKDKGWVSTAGGEYAVDSAKIDELLTALETQLQEEPVAKNQSRHVDLGVDSAGATSVTVESEKGGLVAFYIGNMAQGFSGSYVRLKGQNEVYVSKNGFDRLFTSTPFSYRDKTILKLTKEQIAGFDITYQNGDSAISVGAAYKTESSSWEQTGSETSKFDSKKVDECLARFIALNADEWYTAEDDTATGFATPSYKFVVKKVDGSVLTLITGAEKNGNYFTKVEGDDNRYLIRKFRLEALRPPVADWKVAADAPASTQEAGQTMNMPASGAMGNQ